MIPNFLGFEGGGSLTIVDNPTMRSAWFYRYAGDDHRFIEWGEEDDEYEY